MAATPADSGAAARLVRADPKELEVVDGEAYLLGKELARGGMGRIVEAFDRRHGRPVAIKMLLREGGDALARFVREAAITSRLQHPAIVPVYEAGRWPTGEPFFAMKLVEGRSLDRAIAQAPDLAARLALLPKLVAVSEALAYAHGRGVIHRDLKPHNVLCGDFGETVVIDWGLAKHVGADDVSTLEPAGAGDDALTVVGAAMGTPRYMAPEQARGEPVDERSDVYALGAMLYHLVAGAPPYEGAASGSAMDRVLEGPPPPLAELVPDAPPDLCTIVGKAMARDPGERYASAAQLAAELRRFTSGQLVAAHDYSAWALARRFVARNRAAVAVAAALLAVLGITSVVMVRGIMRERDRAAAERAVAETQRSAAQAERAAAEELVDFIQSDLRERLAPIGRIELLEGVGGRVEAYYRATGSDDAAARARRASALTLVGDLAVISDELDRAEAAYAAALALREQLAREHGGDVEAQRRLALAHVAVADTRKERGDLPGAEAGYAAGLAAARRAVELAPADTGARLALVSALTASAIVQGTRGGIDTAVGHLAEALAEIRALAAADPAHRGQLAAVLLQTAAVEQQRGRFREGRAAVEESIAIRRALAERAPGDTREQSMLAQAHRVRAGILVDLGDGDAALAAHRDERAILERLLTIEPDQTRWQAFLAENHLDVGDRLMLGGDLAGAERELKAALAIAEARAVRVPDDTAAQFALANVRSALGDLLVQRADKGALAHLRAAQAIFDALVARAPDATRWRYGAARGHGSLASAHWNLGDLAAARAEIVRALDDLDALVPMAPAAVVYLQLRAELAVMHVAILDEAKAAAPDVRAAACRATAALDAVAAKDALRPDLAASRDALRGRCPP